MNNKWECWWKCDFSSDRCSCSTKATDNHCFHLFRYLELIILININILINNIFNIHIICKITLKLTFSIKLENDILCWWQIWCCDSRSCRSRLGKSSQLQWERFGLLQSGLFWCFLCLIVLLPWCLNRSKLILIMFVEKLSIISKGVIISATRFSIVFNHWCILLNLCCICRLICLITWLRPCKPLACLWHGVVHVTVGPIWW